MTTQPQKTNGIYQVTGETLREAREALGMSQVAAARMLGVSNSAVSSWEAGKSKPWARNHDKLRGLITAGKKLARQPAPRFRPVDIPDLEPEGAQEFVVERSKGDPVRFKGWVEAGAKGLSAKGYECEATLWKTEGGNYVVQVHYVTSGTKHTMWGSRDYLLARHDRLPWVEAMIRRATEQAFIDIA